MWCIGVQWCALRGKRSSPGGCTLLCSVYHGQATYAVPMSLGNLLELHGLHALEITLTGMVAAVVRGAGVAPGRGTLMADLTVGVGAVGIFTCILICRGYYDYIICTYVACKCIWAIMPRYVSGMGRHVDRPLRLGLLVFVSVFIICGFIRLLYD